MQLNDDWTQVDKQDSDILMIGAIPPELHDDGKINLLVEQTQSWIKQPTRQTTMPDMGSPESDAKPDSKTTVSGDGAMSAIIGFQSPYHDQRSVVALLADSPQGYTLLNNALIDGEKEPRCLVPFPSSVSRASIICASATFTTSATCRGGNVSGMHWRNIPSGWPLYQPLPSSLLPGCCGVA